MSKVEYRKLEITVNYDPDSIDTVVSVYWQWRNTPCHKNGVSKTLLSARSDAQAAFTRWLTEKSRILPTAVDMPDEAYYPDAHCDPADDPVV